MYKFKIIINCDLLIKQYVIYCTTQFSPMKSTQINSEINLSK